MYIVLVKNKRSLLDVMYRTCLKHVIPNKLNIYDLAHHKSPCSSLVKLRLHERFFACKWWRDVFENCRMASTLWWLHLVTNFDKVCDFVAKNSTHWISHPFFCNLFSCQITCTRVATRDFHRKLVTRQFLNCITTSPSWEEKKQPCSCSFRARVW